MSASAHSSREIRIVSEGGRCAQRHRPPRPEQLVGLLPDNPGDVIPEGAQLVAVLGDVPLVMPGPQIPA